MFAFLKNNYDLCPCPTYRAISAGAWSLRYRYNNSLAQVRRIRKDRLHVPLALCVGQDLSFYCTYQLCPTTLKKLAPHCRRTAPSWSSSSKPRRTSAPQSVSSTKSLSYKTPLLQRNSRNPGRTSQTTSETRSGRSTAKSRILCRPSLSPYFLSTTL